MKTMQRFFAMMVVAGLLALSGCVSAPQVAERVTPSIGTQATTSERQPPARLIEGENFTIGLESLRDHATFHYSYPSMAVGDTLKLYWKGNGEFSTPILPVQSVGTMAFRVPKTEVANDVGRTAVVTVTIQRPGLPIQTSDPLTVGVRPSVRIEVPAPLLVGRAANGEYALDTDDAEVQVSYPTMKVGDTVGLRWRGRATHDLPTQRIARIEPITFKVPRAMVAQDLGSAVVLTASVGGDGNPLRISEALSATVVEPKERINPPVIQEAAGGRLNFNDFSRQVTITVDDPRIVTGSTLQVWIAGANTHKTPIKTVAGPGPVEFKVDRAVFLADKGSTVVVTASLGGHGNPILVSRPVSLRVLQPTGPDVLADIKARYNVTGGCAGRPAFNCGGVLLRSVDNGAFNPWDPSPTQVAIGATSFTFMRKDAVVRSTYRLAGFIFSTLDEARALAKPVTPLCIYPFDAATGPDQAATKGCGSRGVGSSGPNDFSTCKTVNAITLATWRAYTSTISGQAKQCSLSVRDVAQFELSQEARRNPTGNLDNDWNELMIETWPSGHGRKLPIEAFFYKAGNPQSLANAKVFQQKFKSVTDRWVPVVSINFADQGDPFRYSQADQGVSP